LVTPLSSAFFYKNEEAAYKIIEIVVTDKGERRS
jgi:hypothetical protein